MPHPSADEFDRLDHFINFLDESGTSFCKADIIDDDDKTAGSEGNELIDAIDSGQMQIGPERSDVVEALRTIVDVWNSGFEIASGDDFVTDDLTVNDIFEAEFSRRVAASPKFG